MVPLALVAVIVMQQPNLKSVTSVVYTHFLNKKLDKILRNPLVS